MISHQFGFYKSNNPKNRTRSLLFRIIESEHLFCQEFKGKKYGLYNQNRININIEHVCNMVNQFKDHNNHPNPHPCVLSHC